MLQSLSNLFNATVHRNQEFEQLLKAKDIGRAISYMTSREKEAIAALQEYNTQTHTIMKREDKLIFDDDGAYERTEKRWCLPIPYQQFINEIALVFLYGNPVQWIQKTDGTDKAFDAFLKLLEDTHFDAKVRQCKRIAGAETQSAMLFRVYRNRAGKPEVMIRVLAKSKGDEIRVRRDQYEKITSICWGYYLKEGSQTILHYDIFTADTIYHCKRIFMGWEVVEEENLIEKIPIILFEQQKEWAGVEEMIEREEWVGSRTADTNDYFADPTMMINADLVKNLPEKKEEAKLLLVNGIEDITKAAHLMTWDSAPESKEKEIEWLQQHILTKSFTPQIDFNNMKGLSKVSGKALKQMMLLSDIKASKHKETHDELLDRTASLGLSVIGNVLDVSLKSECEECGIGHKFQEPFGEDIADALSNLTDATDSNLMSQETGVELNPLVKDKKRELERLKAEKKEASETQRNLFKNSTEDEIFNQQE